ncbi:MAG: lipoprotein signal peptidase [Gammaproteobacteria bacterium]|nr:lipoprotein signal peptidase [Gammaproteobacteria bacterium]
MSGLSLREALVAVSWRDSGWRWLWLSLLLIVADQMSKAWVETHYALGDSEPVFFWLDITRLHNRGAAFSFLADGGGWQRHFFSILAVIVSAVLVLWLRTLHARGERVLAVALALVLSGAIGNVIDRFEHGFVIDFIHVHWGPVYFPAFNIADAAITVGAVFLLCDAFTDWSRSR